MYEEDYKMLLHTGLELTKSTAVTEEMSAVTMHSGGLHVFATPMMIALMEEAALECVDGYMDDGMTTVGTRVDIEHLSPTPVGCTVRARAVLSEIDRRRLVFTVEAHDEKGIIGRGTHERFIVDKEKFEKKCESKNEH